MTNAANAGAGSLRQALLDVPSGGTVCFDTAADFSTPQTITLASSLSIAKSLTISGTGADNLVVSGANSVRVINVSAGVNATLHDLTIRDGRVNEDIGGGILSSGVLTLTSVNVLSNTAGTLAGALGGGIYVTGDLTMTGGRVAENGGGYGAGVYVYSGKTTLDSVEIYSNTAKYAGGGIHVRAGSTTVFSSTIWSNSAGVSGANEGGGGINVAGATAILTNTTVYSNSVSGSTSLTGGGIRNAVGTLKLYGSSVYSNTASGSGGGISSPTAGGTIGLYANSVVSGNRAPSYGGGGIYINGGTLDSVDSAVSGNIASGSGGINAVTSPTIRLNRSRIEGNQATSSNGGGMYMQGGAIAITETVIASNTSGMQGGGFYLVTGSSVPTVTISGGGIYSNTAATGGGGGYISAGIITMTGVTVAGNLVTGNTSPNYGGGLFINLQSTSGLTITGNSNIYGNRALSGGGIHLESGQLTVNATSVYSNTATGNIGYGGGGIRVGGGALMLTASKVYSNVTTGGSGDGGGIGLLGAASVTVVGSDIYSNTTLNRGGGVALIANSSTVSITGGSRIYGNSAGTGGGVYLTSSSQAMTMDAGSQLVDNRAYSGGGLYVNGGNATLDSVGIYSNTGTSYGGGIYSKDALTVTNSTVTGNTCTGAGGGIGIWGGAARVIGGRISDNRASTAAALGGGVHVIAGGLALTGVDIANNTAVAGGGGAYVSGGVLTITVASLSGNSAYHGGGIGMVAGTAIVSGTSVAHNTASYIGGGISISTTAVLTFTNGIITQNQATGNGGGVSVMNTAQVKLDGSSIYSNTSAANGGGIYHNGSQLNLIASSIYGNVSADGGGIYSSRPMQATNSTLARNRANGSGGAVYNNNSLSANTLTIADNTATGAGGGVFAPASTTTVLSNTVSANNKTAGTGGGDLAGSGTFNLSHVLTGTTTLGPLQNNGGATWTMALMPDSLAIDAGTGCPPPATDQRGVSRPQGSACDLGAFEALPTLLVTAGGTGRGTVISTPAGIYCGDRCAAEFAAGTQVTLTVTISNESIFAGWSGACTGTGDCVVTMNQSPLVTATFTANQYALTAAKEGNGSGTVGSSPAAIDCGATCAANVDYGTVITLTATPDANSAFSQWSGACAGTGSCVLTIGGATDITATFALKQYTIATSATPAQGGTATRGGVYDHGATVTITATANAGYSFANWSDAGGPVSTDPVYAFTAAANRTLTATFTANQYALTAAKEGNGSGTVGSSPAAIDCGATCAANVDYGTIITLTATPDANSAFSQWSGACAGTGSCVLTIGGATDITATFALKQYTINTSATPAQGGTATRGGVYDHGATVTITATANAGYTFANWSDAGGAVSTDPVYAFTAAANRTLTATFSLNQYALTAAKEGNGSGTVSSSPAAIDCGATCAANIDYGTVITLTATPDANSTFNQWSGACAGTGSCVLTIGGATDITATFALKQYTINTSAAPTAGGTATGGGVYDLGATVIVTATVNAGYSFANWSDAGGPVSTDPVYAFTASADRTLTATFALKQYTIATDASPAQGGTATGSGVYDHGATVIITATANAGYTFANWSDAGGAVSADPVYAFAAAADRTLTAAFTPLPVAVNDAAGTLQGKPVNVYPLVNDLDPVLGGLIIVQVNQPAHGSAVVSGDAQSVAYTPAADYVGLDSFAYTMQDVNGARSSASVAIVVSAQSKDGPPQVAVVDNNQRTTATFTGTTSSTALDLPAGSYNGTAGPLGPTDIFFVTYTPVVTPTEEVDVPPDTLKFANTLFTFKAFFNTTVLEHYQFAQPVTVTVSYTPGTDINSLAPESLQLYYWDAENSRWSQSGIVEISRDLVNHTITYQIAHFSQFAIFGAPQSADAYLYLPSVIR